MFKRSFSYRLLAIGLGIIVMGYCTEGFGQKPIPPHPNGVVPPPMPPPHPRGVVPPPVPHHPRRVVPPPPVVPHRRFVVPPPVLPWGRPIVNLPVGYVSVWVGGANYFYNAGVFYQKRPNGFIVAPPPVGAIIASIPVGFQVVVIGGLAYYCYGGAYYQRVPSGYIVVEAPPGVVTVEEPSALIQVPETARGRVSVTAHTLNVRSGPGSNRPVIHQMYQGNILAIYGNAPGWLYVKLPSGKFGWVMQKFTVQVSPPASG